MHKNRLLVVGVTLLFMLSIFMIVLAGELEPQAYLPVVYNPLPSPTPMPTPTPRPSLVNGDFEAGHVGWLEYSEIGYPIIVQDNDLPTVLNPHGGQWATWFGGDDNELSAIIQYLTLPTGTQGLTYYRWIASNDVCNPDYDIAGITMDDDGDVTESDVIDAFILCGGTSTNGWRSQTVDVSRYAGKQVELTFLAATDGIIVSSLFVDDVSLRGDAFAAIGEVEAILETPLVLSPQRPEPANAALGKAWNDSIEASVAALQASLVGGVQGPLPYKE